MGLWEWLRRTSAGAPASGRPAASTGPVAAHNPDMGQMVRMLAQAPEEQRQAMLRDRLETFAGQEPEARERGMRMMLEAALGLPDEDYGRLAASRLAALESLDEPTRMTLMGTHAATVKQLPAELRDKEMRATRQVLAGLPKDERRQVQTMMQQAGLGT